LAADVIDLHCHVLPGIDDGPATVEGSIALARVAHARGVRDVVATPHVSSRYPNRPESIVRGVEQLNERLADAGVALEVRPGAELAMTRLIELEAQQIGRYALGGGEWLLVECPLASIANGFEILVMELQRRGHRVLLAHPERCPTFQRNLGALASLVDAGALTSITAGALVGNFGADVRRFALRLVQEDMVHNVASDAHDDARRPPGMRAELAAAGLEPLTDWLTREVPAAILSGGEVPPRPAVALPELKRAARSRWRLSRR
jgi:protein-tyrosine phosphatase